MDEISTKGHKNSISCGYEVLIWKWDLRCWLIDEQKLLCITFSNSFLTSSSYTINLRSSTMLSVKLLLLLATFSALEMMVFHVNIAPQLQHEKEGSKVAITLPLPSPLVPMQTEAPSTPEPSTPPYVPPVHRLTTAPEKLYKNQQSSEGRKTEQQQQQQQPPPRSPPSPLTTEPPFYQLPSSQKETQHRSHYQSEHEQRARYKQEVEYSTSRHSQQEMEDEMARRERLRYENQGSHIGVCLTFYLHSVTIFLSLSLFFSPLFLHFPSCAS